MSSVTLYATTTCPWCKKTREYLDQHDIEYTEYDVSNDGEKAQEMIEKSGQRGVPVIEVDGQIVVGFNKGKISDALGLSE